MKVHDFEAAVSQLKPFLAQYLQEQGIDPTKKFLCPFPEHEDHNPSCNLVGEDGDSPRFYCHGCQRSGDIFDAVQIFERKPRVGTEWVQDTLKYLASKYSVEVKTKDLTEEEIYELDTYRAYRAAADLIKSTNLDSVRHKLFIDHAHQRGWEIDVLETIGIGTVTSYHQFRETLKAQGFPAAFLDEIDLSRSDIFNEENMIFTWRDEKNRPIGFTSRNLKFEQQKAEAERNGQKLNSSKYNNQRTTGLRCNIFQKGKRLYGIETALKDAPPLYIFEGQTDAITAKIHGLWNCVAVAGNALRTDHIHLLKQLQMTDIIVCFDGDKPGQDRMKEIIEDQLAGNRDMSVKVIVLPEEHDPDSYIRAEGLESFKNLACWSAFEWRLQQYEEDADPYVIGKQMVPLIMNESSAVTREQLCKALASRTGISLRSIQSELDTLLDARAVQKSRERQDVIDHVIHELRGSPTDAEIILNRSLLQLSELVRKHDSDTLSNDDFVKDITTQRMQEENEEDSDIGFEMGPDLRELREILRGACSYGTFLPIGGKPNHGKTALLSKLAWEIAMHNDDVTVLYHSIDDTIQQIVPRFVCIGEGSCRLTINMVRQPRYWSKTVSLPYVEEKRSIGYEKLRHLAQEGRLVVKDVSHGSTLPFAENLIKYFQDKYPERRIVYILDNIHKLRDFEGKDERVRFKTISESCKGIALRHRISFWGSAEYTKLPPGIKPSNTNIAETGQIEYDANFIAHVYNEMGDIPDSYKLAHRDVDWRGQAIILPRVEVIVGKNKITEQKRSFFLDFWPASSDYRHVDIETVAREAQQLKQEREDGGSVDDPLDGWGNKEE